MFIACKHDVWDLLATVTGQPWWVRVVVNCVMAVGGGNGATTEACTWDLRLVALQSVCNCTCWLFGQPGLGCSGQELESKYVTVNVIKES